MLFKSKINISGKLYKLALRLQPSQGVGRVMAGTRDQGSKEEKGFGIQTFPLNLYKSFD